MKAEDSEPRILAAGSFEGDLRHVITRWKFRKRRLDTGLLADMVANAVRAERLQHEFDIVTWAPTSDDRRRERGYDQAELVARAASRRLGLPCRRLLMRRSSRPQTGRSRIERLTDAPLFDARPTLRALRVIVIDDVVTTGSTLRSAEVSLRRAGYGKVALVAIARTPGDLPSRTMARGPAETPREQQMDSSRNPDRSTDPTDTNDARRRRTAQNRLIFGLRGTAVAWLLA